MSLCINPHCPNPHNPDNVTFCQTCGSEVLLQARYRVISKLGQGGFGVTFAINEVRTNNRKVLKVLIQNDPKAIQLFQQEAEVLSRLNHPGIPQVELDAYFEFYPHKSRTPIYCLVMEKIEGMDLEEYIKQRGSRPIDQTSAIQWLKDLVTILDQVHSENFFHRDIKPSNIMLRAENGHLVLIDFGTARKLTPTVVNQQGGVTRILSAGYTPSEQMNFNAVPQSDFFALGRTFVYLLTGKQPLDPAIYDDYNDRLNWRIHAPHISSMLADLLDDMMQRLYKDRPQNTQEILRRIAAIEKALQPPKPLPPKPLPPKPQPQKLQPPKPQPQPASRRDFIRTVGLFVGGVTVTVVGQNLFSGNKNQTSTNTPTNTPTPKTGSSSNTPTPQNTPAQGNITNRRNSSAKYFEEDLGNGVKLEMVEIPGGTFLMGSPASETERDSDEGPQRRVTVPSFFMARYQLTQKQYQAIIGSNPARFKGENRPVEQVSWDDAVTFCQRLSQRTGKNYRLPSEAQWEYACRAGTTTPFYFGESITPDLVNYDGNYPYASAPKGMYRKQTINVGSFPPNAFGLCDMHGNVWEWCLDAWVDNYNNAPTDGSAATSSTSFKLLRGGSWSSGASQCRSAARLSNSREIRFSTLGFRVVVFSRTQ
ncbi:SUMF1/EgtB/PvdOfamily nonheme iron enzyme [Anabaena sp. UHCC 0253]|uniref:bifunctional serine/threonine-protein kinase/formylglycine-generating enzyme family protein n=1 Tax=Anabaena sp. UHCC 0253 TaxID=2590019 RepID=UPI001447C309|nr:bifunctional serine/threonine-protein kinase/formylglycine-generating enzyme family protein [Anabaena sp. UHCC 0253]MTJ51315.1 SUMF1/EgtB/PvdOfamily nonheme iron enzyme [Anabaena sp. UHCC 0253]